MLLAATMLPIAAAQASAWRPPPFDPNNLRRAGYTLVFDEEFDDLADIDFGTSANGKPGSKFYGRTFDKWGGVRASAKPTNLTVADGVLTIAGGQIASIAPASNSSLGYVGTTFQGGAYFEARLAWDRNKVGADPRKPIDNAENWWPSFYSVPAEYFTGRMQWPGQPPGYVHFVENDWFEAWHGDYYGATLHDWYGPLHCYGAKTPLGYCHISNEGVSNAHPDDPMIDGVTRNQNKVAMGSNDPTGFHTIGVLWVSARHARDGIGYVHYFFDGKPTMIWKSWSAKADKSRAPPTGEAIFSALDDDHSVIFIGAPRKSPLRVDWIRVWQLPNAESNPPVDGAGR